MKIDIENYTGRFFAVIDEKNGDEYLDFFTSYEETLKNAGYQWSHLSDFDKKNRRISVIVGHTDQYLDDFDELCSSDDDFIEKDLKTLAEIFLKYKNHSEDAAKKEAAEKKLLIAKENHRQKMEAQNKCIADLKKSSDFEKCLWWKENGYVQPSGDDIVRIKNETGLSWNAFKKMVSEF